MLHEVMHDAFGYVTFCNTHAHKIKFKGLVILKNMIAGFRNLHALSICMYTVY